MKKEANECSNKVQILPEIPLTDVELKVISESGWLHDTHIQIASAMLKKQSTLSAGFQSFVLGQTLSFDICKDSFIINTECTRQSQVHYCWNFRFCCKHI